MDRWRGAKAVSHAGTEEAAVRENEATRLTRRVRCSIGTVVAVMCVLSATTLPVYAQLSGIPRCSPMLAGAYPMSESPTRAWVARFWLEKLAAEVPAADLGALPAGLLDDDWVDVCVRPLSGNQPATAGLGVSGRSADAEIVLITSDGTARQVVRLDLRAYWVYLPPSLMAAGISPNRETTAEPPRLVWTVGHDAPGWWKSNTNYTAADHSGVLAVSPGLAQPGADRVDELVWIDRCGVVAAELRFADTASLHVSSPGLCATEVGLRRFGDGPITVVRGKGGQFTLKAGTTAVRFEPAGTPLDGTWTMTSWKQQGRATRGATGTMQIAGTRLDYGDGCNDHLRIAAAAGSRFGLHPRDVRTLAACPPGTPKTDIADLFSSHPAATYRRNGGTLTITADTITATFTRAGK